MPTIDQLAPAIAASDLDEIPVSQGGLVRRVTRAQMLAGVQPELSVSAGSLLGRSSAGIGAPEALAIGANLTLASGVLSGGAPFSATALAHGRVPVGSDLVPIGQGGHDVSVAFGPFMSGLGGLSGIDLSGHDVTVARGIGRRLSAWLADSVPVEAFGAVGDGITDDTAAFVDAVASGLPVRLGPKTYAIAGQWTIGVSATLVGTPGRSAIKRISEIGGAFVSVQGSSFYAYGIGFDSAGMTSDTWNVLVTSTCVGSVFESCTFQGARGPTLGHGLTIAPSNMASRHVIRGCTAQGNAGHGFWVRSSIGVRVLDCCAYGNGAYGINLDDDDPTFQRRVQFGQIIGCQAWANQRGISVGNFNSTNAQPPVWGNANPDAVGVLVAGNLCHDNTAYGIAIAGHSIEATANFVGNNPAGGILVNAIGSLVAGNAVSGASAFGIDAGGSEDCDISGNRVSGAMVGINPGGSKNVRVVGNTLNGNAWAMTVYNVESDGQGLNFGIPCNGLTINGNRIGIGTSTGGGIYLVDGPMNVVVERNAFFGTGSSDVSQCLWAHTDSVIVRDNTWNNEARFIVNPVIVNGLQQLQFPDIADGIMLTDVPAGVQSMVTQHAASTAGQVAFVRVTAGGSGYSEAQVLISGAGSGAAATVWIANGSVIGIALTQGGSGYSGSAVQVTIEGDGQGATATAIAGLPVPEERRLRVHCNVVVRFARDTAVPFQDNWTAGDISVPAATEVTWVGTWGDWRAVAFTPGDLLSSPGDGSFVLRTAANDLTLRPSGHLRVGSNAEPFGFASTLGRGSPEGIVTAPAGSDYRNLDGGTGSTLWVKRVGSDANGWAAVA